MNVVVASGGDVNAMPPFLRRVRAYFAAGNRAAGTPVLFNAAATGSFNLDTPPAPWVDLGWIAGFERRCGTKVEAVRSGAPATTQMQVRTEIEATVGLRFDTWGKLQLALSAGFQQMNLLALGSGSGKGVAGAGATTVPAVPLATGSTATVLQVAAGASASFAVGSLVAVDVDNTGQTGFVGSGASGAYLSSALGDVDYIRRITLNVGRVASVGTTSITLEAPLLGGIPDPTMKVSGALGFCDREGSSFFSEWSALFVGEGQQGERVLWHYPRLQAMSGAAEGGAEKAGQFQRMQLAGSFRALPVVDPVDGETVVCFRSYLPPTTAAAQ